MHSSIGSYFVNRRDYFASSNEETCSLQEQHMLMSLLGLIQAHHPTGSILRSQLPGCRAAELPH